MGGDFISPSTELRFGGPTKYRDGSELEGLGPETTYADQAGISPDDPLYDYLNQFGQQGIEVDTKTWLDIVGLLSGAKAATSGGGPTQAMIEQIGSKGLRMAKDYLMEKFGVGPEVVEQSVASGKPVPELAPGAGSQGALPSGASNMQLPGGSAPAAAGRRANALQRLSSNELPSSGDLFIGHPGNQTRNVLGQYGPNSASGVSTSGQRLPSVRNAQVAVRPNTSTDMVPFSPSGGNLPAVRPNSNTGIVPIGSGTVLSESGVSPRLGSATRAGIIGAGQTTDMDERPGRPSPFTSVFPEQIQGFSYREPDDVSPAPTPNPSPNPNPNPSRSSGSPEFNQAFREARHRGDMVFEWNGKSYGTRRKGETNDEHQMAMDQVRIKSRGAQMRNNPTEIGVQETKEISFDGPTAQLQTPQRPAAAKAAPKSEPTGRAKIKANRQENRSTRQGIRQERRADKKENRAGRLENRAAKLRGNSKPAAKSSNTSNKAKEDKAMQQINAAANRPMKDGGKKQMIKRADGSTSQRGLWDNIRANKGSGKKPTKEMLKQEKKIKAESKKDGGLKTPTNKGLKKLPKNVRNKMGFKKEGGLKDRRK